MAGSADPKTTRDGLAFAMLIVARCREEGREAARAGADRNACPYCPYSADAELEREGWMAGWSKEAARGKQS